MALITIIVGFILTTVCGNWLITRWQQRNWVNQHRFLSVEKDLQELQATINQIASLGDARNYRARVLVRALRDGDELKIKLGKDDYDKSVASWNDNFNTIFNRLTIYASYQNHALRFERDINDTFFAIGSKIATCMKEGKKLSTSQFVNFESELSGQSGRICIFCRDLLNEYQKKKKKAYEGEDLIYSAQHLPNLSTWQLLQFLFKRPHQL